ncbi:hypothetical protein KR51_00017260 [Rubidibacter lacunae KORDI 51-2]|uniref:Uncharacterized protein n=1 Tax=Rubidibacter lacunae KORDI 51-2 TaxID=582515 RepID=U5DAS9_9CHRO|nr:hypothetical protein [Rubidibacter lacunae]ERN41648.1 hypothetical protein KR51_00017260 [Rubidibacter lacunae KORDI 51-2]
MMLACKEVGEKYCLQIRDFDPNLDSMFDRIDGMPMRLSSKAIAEILPQTPRILGPEHQANWLFLGEVLQAMASQKKRTTVEWAKALLARTIGSDMGLLV